MNLSIKLFLAFILSNITQKREVFISDKSIITFDERIFNIPGEPYQIREDPVYEYFCNSPNDANLLYEKV